MHNRHSGDGYPPSTNSLESHIRRVLKGDDPNGQPWDEVTLERDGDVPIAFDGLLLGEDETHVEVLDRQHNAYTRRGHRATIYKTKSGKYVVGFVAWSWVSTETDRCKAIIAESPEDLYQALTSLTAKGIPDAALGALRKAAVSDPALQSIAVQRI